jgi:DNA polymerase-3 subunit delta|tara:strand:+ start:135 stop:1133 length:999 start_codon:yes stop_codon:yes gene_type:complete
MIIKSYIAEQNISSLNNYIGLLIYGENGGLKDDLKKVIKKENSDAEIINLYQDDILKDENILNNHIKNNSLFNNKKIIFINEANDKILKQIESHIEQKLDTKIFIISNLLDKKSKLRNIFEKKKDLGIIPCYLDNERTLFNYVSSNLKNVKGVTPEVINIIISNSNLNRRIIKNEIEKIINLFEKDRVDIDKLEQLLNIKFNDNFNLIRDACLLGEKKKANDLLSQIDFRNEEFVLYIHNITSRMIKLLEIANVNKNVKNVETALEVLKLKVFWKDKPILIQQLSKWKVKDIEWALKKVGETELLIKKNSQINNSTLIKVLLVDLCYQASTL